MIQPNKHGVYPHDLAEHISFDVAGKATCQIDLLEVGGEWLVAVDTAFHLGDYNGSSGPLMRDEVPFTSRRDALIYGLDCGLRHFHTRERWGCATAKQVEFSIAMHNKLANYRAMLSGDISSLPAGSQLGMFVSDAAAAQLGYCPDEDEMQAERDALTDEEREELDRLPRPEDDEDEDFVCGECGVSLNNYYEPPCGRFCEECYSDHARGCAKCAHEAGFIFDDAPEPEPEFIPAPASAPAMQLSMF